MRLANGGGRRDSLTDVAGTWIRAAAPAAKIDVIVDTVARVA